MRRARRTSATEKPLRIAALHVAKDGKQVRKQYSALRAGVEVEVHAPADAVFGTPVLVASETGRYVDAVGFVIGEPVHYKHKKTRRCVFITNRLPQSETALGAALAGGRTRCRRATEAELKRALAASFRSKYTFARDAALGLPAAKQTIERRCVGFLAGCVNSMNGLRATTEAHVLGAHNSRNRVGVVKDAQADLIIRLPEKGARARLLVVEAEWSKVGGAESVGQAYEYAARLRRGPGFADSKQRLGLTSDQLARAELLPVVVANNVPDTCLIGEALNIEAMDYSEFLRRLTNKDFDTLQPFKGRPRR